MPFFNFSNNNRQTVDLNSEELVNYLTDGDSGKYVSANKALANSDLYSLIAQLSADLAWVRFQTTSNSSNHH